MNAKKATAQNKHVIPVFFAADDNYAPYLSVAVCSLAAHATRRYRYAVHVLHAGLTPDNARRLLSPATPHVSVTLIDVTEKLAALRARAVRCDAYLGADYYRVFIAEMFPQYDKAVYLDADVTVLGDVAELFATDLGGYLLGAVPDADANGSAVLRRYASRTLGILPQSYFNDGVLLLNLHALRQEYLYERFLHLLDSQRFPVAQAQDYFNVLCRDRVLYLNAAWNAVPQSEEHKRPAVVHYSRTRKPWHYDDVPYRAHFWRYALMSPFLGDILDDRLRFTPECAASDADCETFRSVRATALCAAQGFCHAARHYADVYGV